MSPLQIIVPMSGFGERFRRKGYTVPKPLIEVEGKPIIAHIIDMFPGEKNYFFICNQEHLNNPKWHMESILRQHCKTSRIIGISPHKLGPVHAVCQIEDLIDPKLPTIVNYCDFTCYWDWHHFKRFVFESGCIGAIPAYKGFHPHSLGKTNYAYMLESNSWVKDIQEKKPYTDNRMEEFASSGTYYFSSGEIMLKAFHSTMDQELNVGGEYYVSLAYKPFLDRHLPVAVYPLQHFMQWGTPEDLEEYNYWSKTFRLLTNQKENSLTTKGVSVIPMAGLGKRFADEGYREAKPLISVSGRPMVIQAMNDLPKTQHKAFVLREDLPGYHRITNELKFIYPNAIIETIPKVTEGQACTAMLGLEALRRNLDEELGPITFGTCDNGALYDIKGFQSLINNPNIDIVVWGIRGYANAIRYPHMFGWIKEENNLISEVSVKKPLDSPNSDPIIIGTFTFCRANDFSNCVSRLVDRDGRVNGEFYIDSCINEALAMGLRCHLFEVDSFISWGTPNDLKTFEYWQSCFHKWKGHPYCLELDRRIPADQLPILEKSYSAIFAQVPKEVHDKA